MILRVCGAAAATALLVAGCSESSEIARDGGPDARIVLDAQPRMDGGDGGSESGPTPGEGEIGAACGTGGDCNSEFCASEGNFIFPMPGGYCVSRCGSNGECPDGSSCANFGRAGSFCLDNCNPDASTRNCRSGYGCATGDMLPNPVCLPGCSDDSDCMDGQQCNPDGGFVGEGRCFNPDSSLGDACADGSQCPSDSLCVSESQSGQPGGTCIGFPCEVESNSGCPGDAQCLPSARGGGICLDGCEQDGDCREGYACEASSEFPERQVCTAACESDDQCTGDRVCNPALGTCDVPFEPDQLGDACSQQRGACTGGTCLSEFRSGFPGSYCTFVGCDPEASDDNDGCPGDGVCLDPGGDSNPICIDGCDSGAACRQGYECRQVDPDDASRGMGCFPACTEDSQCANNEREGFVCNQGTGFCTAPFVDNRFGTSCRSDEDCPGGDCLTESGDGWPEGTCVAVGCRLSGEGPSEACPEGGVCVDDDSGTEEIGMCLVGCDLEASTDPCRTGYSCQPATEGSDQGTCRPDCDTGDFTCGGDRSCSADSGLCE
jgi:hypothetical protein